MPYDKEIIVVDDGSLDGTRSLYLEALNGGDIRVVFHEKNAGKGAAVRSGIKIATGISIIIRERGNGKKRGPGRAMCTSRRAIAKHPGRIALAIAKHPVRIAEHPVRTQPTKAYE